jgi:3-hydroxyisobutyrate dehydrogenase-like beta-hydroxyacid dehydrogenase
MSDRMRIGYVGVGLMGHGAAKHIFLKGWPLTILGHRNRVPVDDLVARGVTEARDIADLVARSDAVFLCLSTAAQVEEMMLGSGGMAALLRPGMIVVDKTTGDPAFTRRLGALLADRGVSMIDAPIGRSPAQAEEGKLSTLLGGDPAVIARVRPVIECYADTIIEAGPLGAALTVKIVNNFISFCNAVAISETFAAAAKLGVDFKPLCAMIEAGGSNSVMFQWIKPWILDGDDSFGRGRLASGEKVLQSYIDLAKAGGAPTVMADAASRVLAGVLESGHGDRYLPRLPGVLAAMAGAPFRDLE